MSLIRCTVLGTNVVSYDIMNVWYRKFRCKDCDIQEAERSGRPVDVDEARLRELKEDQCATARELAKEIDVRTMSIRCTVHGINLTYKFNRWKPQELAQADKDRRVRACTNLPAKKTSESDRHLQ
ncbi:histone-lysine N-methyltransferase SETMAR-like [Stegodyphus dumicola]|uniref:histone-lysine N-methyltransferase SETMAR-like n=1 Tax=Stegodyphus dumicola TaxID=202533 RepID=UPI0015B15C45|nr:histone-lysine N-methyltransferase SETMAR-like [Stegodyphus dumicola]